MLSLRARIFIVLSLAVLLILGISLILVIGGKKTKQNNEQSAPMPNGQTGNVIDQSNFDASRLQSGDTNTPSGLPVKVQTTLEAEKHGVEQLAKIFMERYGSYSTDSDFQNIKEVASLVTPAMWLKISGKIGSAQNQQNFVGVTTKVITANLIQWSESQAVVELRVMRAEEKSGNTANKFQTAEVYLVKTGGQWLVDKFVWK